MAEYQRQQSNEKKNKTTENNYESKQKEKKVNKFEFKDFKPNVFTNEQSFFNTQQPSFEPNNRKTEIRKQILIENNIPTRNPFSTQRQMPSIPQIHRGNINKNDLYSIFESQPQKEIDRNQTMNFSNIERQQLNYTPRSNNQQYSVNSQYMQNRVNPMPNTHTNFTIQNTPSFNINKTQNYHFPMEVNQSSIIGDNPYLRRDQPPQIDLNQRQDIRNRNNSSMNINFNRQSNKISKYNTTYPPINSNKGNIPYSMGSIRELNTPNVKPMRNVQIDSPNKNPILDFDSKKNLKVETRRRKKTKKLSVETADSLQSLSSENEKLEKKVKQKKKKVKTYTHFYSKTDLFGSEKVKGYEMTLDPINLFEDYDIFKGKSFCNESIEGNIFEFINKDIVKRKNLRKITNLLQFLKETNKTKETGILNEFFNTENSIVSLGFEEIEAALKVMFDFK